MPGRGWDYANQNLQLLQGGMASFGQAIDQRRALEQQNAEASPIEKMLGRDMAARIHEMLAAGADPHELAVRIKLGDPAVVGPQQPAPSMAAPLMPARGEPPPLLGPPRVAARGVNPMGAVGDGGMAGAPSAPTPASPSPMTDTRPQAPAPMAPQPFEPPPIATRREFQAVMGAGEVASRFMPKSRGGLTLEEQLMLEDRKQAGRKDLEDTKQAGAGERTDKRIEVAKDKNAISREKLAQDRAIFAQSVHEINNAMQLAQARFEHALTLSQDKGQAAAQVRLMGQLQQDIAAAKVAWSRIINSDAFRQGDEEARAYAEKAYIEVRRLEMSMNDLRKRMNMDTSVPVPGGAGTDVMPGPTHGQGGPGSFGPSAGQGGSTSIYTHEKKSGPQGR